MPTLEELLEYMDNLEVEAIKEFAERLKDGFLHKSDFYAFWGIEKRIDNLVKEMVGDAE